MPFVDIRCDDRKDYVGWVCVSNRSRGVRSLAKSEIAVLRHLVDTASSLIELQPQTHDVLVKVRCLCKVARVEECDLRIDWWMRHRRFSPTVEWWRYCSMVSLNVPVGRSGFLGPGRCCLAEAVGVCWQGCPFWHYLPTTGFSSTMARHGARVQGESAPGAYAPRRRSDGIRGQICPCKCDR